MFEGTERYFDENELYCHIKIFAQENHMEQTLRVLPYVREMHQGQFRSGRASVPYIYHPLMVACHAIAIGVDDDNIICAALLHDVCEDCNIAISELPVNDTIREIVALLTHGEDYYLSDESKKVYFKKILENRSATMIKLLDRCNNVSSMATGFDKYRRMNYIKNTQEWFYPIFQKARERFPEYNRQIFLIEYHMKSVVESIKNIE